MAALARSCLRHKEPTSPARTVVERLEHRTLEVVESDAALHADVSAELRVVDFPRGTLAIDHGVVERAARVAAPQHLPDGYTKRTHPGTGTAIGGKTYYVVYPDTGYFSVGHVQAR